MCEVVGYDRETIHELGIDGISVTDEGYSKAKAKEFFGSVAETDGIKQTEWAVETSDGETR